MLEDLSSDLYMTFKTMLHWYIFVTLALEWGVCVERQLDLSEAPWPASLVKNKNKVKPTIKHVWKKVKWRSGWGRLSWCQWLVSIHLHISDYSPYHTNTHNIHHTYTVSVEYFQRSVNQCSVLIWFWVCLFCFGNFCLFYHIYLIY